VDNPDIKGAYMRNFVTEKMRKKLHYPFGIVTMSLKGVSGILERQFIRALFEKTREAEEIPITRISDAVS
jgi:hypothetical protein